MWLHTYILYVCPWGIGVNFVKFISEESFKTEEFFKVLVSSIITISKRYEFPGPWAACEFFKLEIFVLS